MAQHHATASDEELLRQLMAGDGEAFEMLYERRQGAIYRFALRMSGAKTVAEDVTQDVFMALMRDGRQYDPTQGSVAAYLFGMARHLVLRALRRDRPLVPMADLGVSQAGVVDEPFIVRDDPLADVARHETIASVRQVVLALPLHYREVVVLCHLHEMSYEEAAEVLECAVGTVRSRLHRARALMLRKLQMKGKRNETRESLKTARILV